MVLLKTAMVGALLLVVGVSLLTVAGSYITVQAQVVRRHDVESHAQFRVGDLTEREYSLPGSVAVFGTLDVAQVPTNQSSDLQFMVLDTQNYQLWSSGQQSTYLFTSDHLGHSNFTFTAPASGVYHFVFDNRASIYKKYVTLSIGYNEVLISNQPDPRVPYVGWGLLVVGLVVLIYGVLKRPPITWA
jgi:hypothetical protein